MVGQFSMPIDTPDEEGLIFIVLEDRYPRVLVVDATTTGKTIPPTFSYQAADMVEIK